MKQPQPGEERNRGAHPALEAIEEAMKRGDFDNLPGRGKPLNLDPRLLRDPQAFTNQLRHNAHLGTPWEELGREIEAERARAERDLLAAHRRAEVLRSKVLARKVLRAAAKSEAKSDSRQWTLARSTFERRVDELNRKILTYNLLLPPALPHLYKKRMNAAARCRELGIDE